MHNGYYDGDYLEGGGFFDFFKQKQDKPMENENENENQIVASKDTSNPSPPGFFKQIRRRFEKNAPMPKPATPGSSRSSSSKTPPSASRKSSSKQNPAATPNDVRFQRNLSKFQEMNVVGKQRRSFEKSTPKRSPRTSRVGSAPKVIDATKTKIPGMVNIHYPSTQKTYSYSVDLLRKAIETYRSSGSQEYPMLLKYNWSAHPTLTYYKTRYRSLFKASLKSSECLQAATWIPTDSDRLKKSHFRHPIYEKLLTRPNPKTLHSFNIENRVSNEKFDPRTNRMYLCINNDEDFEETIKCVQSVLYKLQYELNDMVYSKKSNKGQDSLDFYGSEPKEVRNNYITSIASPEQIQDMIWLLWIHTCTFMKAETENEKDKVRSFLYCRKTYGVNRRMHQLMNKFIGKVSVHGIVAMLLWFVPVEYLWTEAA